MKRLPAPVAFGAGFVLATAIGLVFVLPAARTAWRINTDSDVDLPIEGALRQIEQTATRGECAKAAAQLHSLVEKLVEYRAGNLPDWSLPADGATRPNNGG